MREQISFKISLPVEAPSRTVSKRAEDRSRSVARTLAWLDERDAQVRYIAGYLRVPDSEEEKLWAEASYEALFAENPW